MLLKVLLLLFFAEATQAYFKGSIQYGDYEYGYYADGEDNLDWNTAHIACPYMPYVPSGSTLAMAKTSGIANTINTLLSYYNYPATWLGAHDIHGEGYWIWVDGTPLFETYTNWMPGEPNNDKGDEDCLSVNLGTIHRQWNDKPCRYLLGYVCQILLTRAVPSDYSQLTVYEPSSMARTFLEAKSECDRIGARLVEVPDERSREVTLKKLESSGHNKYWVNMANTGSSCSILSQDGSEERDCDEKQFGFICETARPNLLKVSDEHPEVTENGNVEIHCSASGYPLPDVAWYKDDEFISDQSIGVASSTLFIKNAAQSEAGKYTCSASNTINGRMSKVMRISEVSVVTDKN